MNNNRIINDTAMNNNNYNFQYIYFNALTLIKLMI